MENEILIVQKQENICTIILNRPEKRNSLTLKLLNQIYEVFTELYEDDSVRSVIIRGAGNRAFCSGFDITALPVKAPADTLKKIKEEHPLEKALKSIEDYPYPVIAMLNGHAFGAGFELAISCDFRIGADGIKVGMPPAKIGIVYSVSGLQRFINVIGLRSTKEMFFTGNTYFGLKLNEMGLVDYLVPEDELESFTYDFAAKIAANASLALKGTKKIINMLLKKGEMSDEDIRISDLLVAEALQSDDLKEGQTAFFEKRKPKFSGK